MRGLGNKELNIRNWKKGQNKITKYKGTISHAFLRPRCAKKDYHPSLSPYLVTPCPGDPPPL